MTTYTPTTTTVRSNLDEIGVPYNVDRLPGETLPSYSERLLDTFLNRGSSTYTGLINAINRELGLSQEDVLRINIKSIFNLEKSYCSLYSSRTISVTYILDYIVDGVNVIASGDSISILNGDLISESLIGFTVDVAGSSYNIIANTENSITIDGDLSNVLNESINISFKPEDNTLTGLGLVVDSKLYTITQNKNNLIEVKESGLEESFTFTSTIKVEPKNPRVEVTASKLVLYRDYLNKDNYRIDRYIDLRKDAIFLKDLVEQINQSQYFEAEDLTDSRDNRRSISLKKQTSDHLVSGETIPGCKSFSLEESINGRIKEGTLSFSETGVFYLEVDEANVGNTLGSYYVDYSNGSIICSSLPSGEGTVAYTWMEFPYTLVSSHVIINSFFDSSSKEFLYKEVELERYESPLEKTAPGQPSADTIEYIGELFSVKDIRFGD